MKVHKISPSFPFLPLPSPKSEVRGLKRVSFALTLVLLLSVAHGQQTTVPKLEVGMLAPDFSVSDHNGNVVNLKDFVGKKAVLLVFYPKADTPG